MSKPLRQLLILASAALALAAVSGVRAATYAGRFEFVHGPVHVVRSGAPALLARKGERVEPGDTIVTGPHGSAQLLMVDKAFLAVRPKTRLRIDAYSYDQPGKPNRSFFSLLSGVFRAVTGLIGKTDHAAYRVRTQTATIGIRGSDGELGYDPGRGLTAVRTYEGAYTLTVTNREGRLVTVVVNRDQIAEAIAGGSPEFVSSFPIATVGAGEPGAGAGAGAKNGAGGGTTTGGSSAPASGETNATTPPKAPARVIAIGSGTTPLNTVSAAPAGSGLVGADLYSDPVLGLDGGAGGVVLDGSAGRALTLGGRGQVVLVTSPGNGGGGGFLFASGNGVLPVFSSYSIPAPGGAGTVNGSWGLWQGDVILVDSGVLRTPVGGLPFAYADDITSSATLASLGSATAPVAFNSTQIGMAATNEAGALPSLYTAKAAGVFSGGADLGSVAIAVQADFPTGSTGWDLGGFGSIAQLVDVNGSGNGVPLVGTCSGCGSVNGKARGLFAGAGAQGLLLSVSGIDATGGKALLGTSVSTVQSAAVNPAAQALLASFASLPSGISMAAVGGGGVGGVTYGVPGVSTNGVYSAQVVPDGVLQLAALGSAGDLEAAVNLTGLGSTGVSAPSDLVFSAFGANLAASGSVSVPTAAAPAAVDWGVWQGNFTLWTGGNARSPVGGFAYAYADNVTSVSQLASLGATGPVGFIYSYLGGAAVNEAGAVASSGQTLSATATGQFTGGASLGSISLGYGASFSHGSTNWSLSGQGTIADLIGVNGLPLGGMCSGCSGSASGRVHGLFTGSAADGLLTGFAASAAGGKSIAGAVVEQFSAQ